MRRSLARTLVVTVTVAVLGILANAPSTLAYGSNTQWQVGFSGTCSPQAPTGFFCPGGVVTGFWGWCAFGGSAPDGLSGTAADCQVETYFGPGTSLQIAYDVTHWTISTGSHFLPPGVPGFFITPGAGTLEITGPGPVPPFVTKGVPFPIPNPCPAFICDTGIPAVAGHVSLHPTSGAELEIQVTKLP